MSKKSDKPSLTELYKTEHTRDSVWEVLSEDFDYSFERLMKEARSVKALIAKPARLHKEKLRELYIEYGFELETLEHLKKMLDEIKVLDNIDECDDSQSSICYSQKE